MADKESLVIGSKVKAYIKTKGLMCSGDLADAVSDPWDMATSREGEFVHLLRKRYPQFEIADLTPILDRMKRRVLSMISCRLLLTGFS